MPYDQYQLNKGTVELHKKKDFKHGKQSSRTGELIQLPITCKLSFCPSKSCIAVVCILTNPQFYNQMNLITWTLSL